MLKARNLEKRDITSLRSLYEERDIPIAGKSSDTTIWAQFARRMNAESQWAMVLTDEESGGDVLGISIIAITWRPNSVHSNVRAVGMNVANIVDFYVRELHRAEGEPILAKASIQACVALSAIAVTVSEGVDSPAWVEFGLVPDPIPRMYKALKWNKPNTTRPEQIGYYEHIPGIDPKNYRIDESMEPEPGVGLVPRKTFQEMVDELP